MSEPTRQISPERKALYYWGNGLAIAGILLFLSVFVTAALNIGHVNSHSDFQVQVRSSMLRAVCGFIMIIVGAVISNIGAKGAAGSGVLLDPERARKDVEPWSRMAGGVAQDSLDEIEVVKKIGDHLESTSAEVVKVRCRKCRALNDEAARFCNQCGAEL